MVSVVAGKLCLSVLSMPKNETPPLTFSNNFKLPSLRGRGSFRNVMVLSVSRDGPKSGPLVCRIRLKMTNSLVSQRSFPFSGMSWCLYRIFVPVIRSLTGYVPVSVSTRVFVSACLIIIVFVVTVVWMTESDPEMALRCYNLQVGYTLFGTGWLILSYSGIHYVEKLAY